MPVKLSKVQTQGEPKTIRIDFGEDGDLNLTVLPGKVTIGSMRRLQRAADGGDVAGVADEFFSWVTEWDLLDDENQVYPLTAETIDLLGGEFFGDLAERIQEAAVPNPATSTS